VRAVADRPGRQLAGHRPAGRHGADLGSGHRHPTPHPHRPHRQRAAVAIAPTAAGWPPAAVDGTVRIWDPVTGTQRHTLTGHTGIVRAVAIAPDGSWLATRRQRRHCADLGSGHRIRRRILTGVRTAIPARVERHDKHCSRSVRAVRLQVRCLGQTTH
jgi:hypothetical protein